MLVLLLLTVFDSTRYYVNSYISVALFLTAQGRQAKLTMARRFCSSRNCAWSIFFTNSHLNGLRGSQGILQVKGSMQGGDFTVQ